MVQDDSSFKESIEELLSKFQQIFLEAVPLDQFPGLEVIINVLTIDLLDCQSAQVPLCFSEDRISKLHINLPKAIVTEFCLIGVVFVALIEHGMEDLLCLNFALHILAPKPMCGLLGKLIVMLQIRQKDHFFQSVIKVFLIVMKGGVSNFSNFLLFLDSLPSLTFERGWLSSVMLGVLEVLGVMIGLIGQFFLN